MTNIKSIHLRSLAVVVATAVFWTLCFASVAGAQGTYRYQRGGGTIDAGTTITVRTNETINTRNSDGEVYTGFVERDVMNRNGYVAIPRGSDVELVVRRMSNNEVLLDLDSVMINGQRYGIEGEEGAIINSDRREGLGTNERTGKYVGGGAVLGAIIGAITGGGKGAAIGAGAGAAAGAGAQVLTRGGSVRVPAETLLTFRLAQPLRPGVLESGYMRDGIHYHSGYPDGYRQSASNYGRQKPGYYSTARGELNIGRDNYITWRGPENASVYVQVDNEAPKLFAAGASGTQAAPWINPGHLYVFVLRDANGNEIARDQQDLRASRPYRR